MTADKDRPSPMITGDTVEFAAGLGPAVPVRRYPPGTSGWTGLERRMFLHVTRIPRGKPPASREVIVNPVTATTETGLSIGSGVDGNGYATGVNVSNDRTETFPIRRTGFHGEWNRAPRPAYELTIYPGEPAERLSLWGRAESPARQILSRSVGDTLWKRRMTARTL